MTEDYDGLNKMYNSDQFITYENAEGLTKFPVVIVGEVVDLPVTEDTITIEDNPKDTYNVPPLVESYFADIMVALDTSIVYNNFLFLVMYTNCTKIVLHFCRGCQWIFVRHIVILSYKGWRLHEGRPYA